MHCCDFSIIETAQSFRATRNSCKVTSEFLHGCESCRPETTPYALMKWDICWSPVLTSDSQYTALHQACHCKEPFEVIKLLVDVGGRELVMAKNGCGRTALSIYLSWRYYSGTKQASLQVVQLFLQGHVGGQELSNMHDDRTGRRCLLHVASFDKAPLEVIQ